MHPQAIPASSIRLYVIYLNYIFQCLLPLLANVKQP